MSFSRLFRLFSRAAAPPAIPPAAAAAEPGIRVCVNRDEVHPADTDCGSLVFVVPEHTPPEDILRRAADMNWLPGIQSDRATWAIGSNEWLAVFAYGWPEPRFMPDLDRRFADVRRADGGIALFFHYVCQEDPERLYRDLCCWEPRSPRLPPRA